MKTIPVQKLMTVSPARLKDGLRTNLKVVFEDGVTKELTFREIIINRYAWDVTITAYDLLRDYINNTLKLTHIPIISDFDITKYYKEGFYVKSTLNKTFEAIVKWITDNLLTTTHNRSIMDLVWKRMMEINNEIFNDVVFDNLDYATSLDIMSFLEIQLQPNLTKAMREVSEVDYNNRLDVDAKIDKTYRELHNIMTSEEFKNNPLAKGYISGTLKPSQVRQVLASRGSITNLNGELYKKPVASSFTSGLYDISEIAMESQTGAKSLKAAKDAVADSEYNARKLQLVTSRIERIADTDCGQTDYVNWFVAPEGDGYKGDFNNMIGSWYYDPKDKVEKVITAADKHLIGTTIKLRTAYNCKHPDKRCVCYKCFGMLSYNIPKHTHIGHLSTVEFTGQLTQLQLSFKHLTSSANALMVSYNPECTSYFENVEDDNTLIKMRKRYQIVLPDDKRAIVDNSKLNLTLKVASRSGRGLSDINKNTDVKKFTPTSVTFLYDMWIVVKNNDDVVTAEIPVIIRKGRRAGSFTTEFLAHYQQSKYTIDADGNYLIPLKGWDYNLPIILIPDVEFSYANFSKSIYNLFGMSSKKLRGGITSDDEAENKGLQEALLTRLFRELNTKLDVNIAFLSTIVRAFSVNDAEAGDYRLPQDNHDLVSTVNLTNMISHSSQSVAYAFQNHTKHMLSPKAFSNLNSINNIMDVFMCPNEAILEYKNNPIKS